MKISFVLGHELSFPPQGGGGVNSLLHALTKALARAGHDVVAYSPTFDGAASDEVVEGVRHIRVKGAARHPNNLRNQVNGLPYAIRVRAALLKCDVLSCHLLSSFLFKPNTKAKVITHTIHRDPKNFLALSSFLDRIYAGSEAVSDEAVNKLPWLRSKVKTVHNCVDFEGYSPSLSNKNDDFTFIYVGRFSRDKGLETLIKAFVNAASNYPNIRLKTIGPLEADKGAEPDFVEEMKKLVIQSGLSDRVTISPAIYDRKLLDKIILQANVVCLPSLGGETLNMSILECLRLSRPVLISDLPANLPLLNNNVSGFLAKVGDAEDWSKSIIKFSEMSNTDYQSMSKNAFEYGLANFASDAIAARYVNDFETLLSAKQK